MTGFNWSKLLKWSSNYIDGSDLSEKVERIDPEKLEFLQGAIREAMKGVVDPNKLLFEAKVKLEGDEDEESMISALAVIDRCVELPDCSLNLEKLGLIKPLLNCLSKSEEIRSLTYQILSKSMQNNLSVQKSFANIGALSIITNATHFESSEIMKSRGISAISSLIRHNTEMEKAFIVENGLFQIKTWLNSEFMKVREKSMSLLRHFIRQGTISYKDILEINKGRIIDTIINLQKENSKNPNELQNIQYGEILSETLFEVINMCKDHMDNEYKEKILLYVVGRADFLSKYVKFCPDDDVSPEINMLVKCEELLRANR
ncbi:hypothetical protein FG386_002555 [Cryptosporidium ryanae]|uniref:uncharacterized protein n=1 Tax=Cryptosporidium ryanae TaxID=515981 RepID=UPI00351A8503|nr:hypothetical protein FG386_002555 [Cryptosporidium ryanae]